MKWISTNIFISNRCWPNTEYAKHSLSLRCYSGRIQWASFLHRFHGYYWNVFCIRSDGRVLYVYIYSVVRVIYVKRKAFLRLVGWVIRHTETDLMKPRQKNWIPSCYSRSIWDGNTKHCNTYLLSILIQDNLCLYVGVHIFIEQIFSWTYIVVFTMLRRLPRMGIINFFTDTIRHTSFKLLVLKYNLNNLQFFLRNTYSISPFFVLYGEETDINNVIILPCGI